MQVLKNFSQIFKGIWVGIFWMTFVIIFTNHPWFTNNTDKWKQVKNFTESKTITSNNKKVSAEGKTVIINGTTMPTMISKKSKPYNYDEATKYCTSLVEAGYDDWYLPTYDELNYAISALTDTNNLIPETNKEELWTRTNIQNLKNHIHGTKNCGFSRWNFWIVWHSGRPYYPDNPHLPNPKVTIRCVR